MLPWHSVVCFSESIDRYIIPIILPTFMHYHRIAGWKTPYIKGQQPAWGKYSTMFYKKYISVPPLNSSQQLPQQLQNNFGVFTWLHAREPLLIVDFQNVCSFWLCKRVRQTMMETEVKSLLYLGGWKQSPGLFTIVAFPFDVHCLSVISSLQSCLCAEKKTEQLQIL